MSKALETFLREYHKLSDKDFIWFPFLFLRPSPNETIGYPKLILMTFCFGLYGSLVWPLKQWLAGQVITPTGWSEFALKCFGFFLVWFSVVTRPLWNSRARALQKS